MPPSNDQTNPVVSQPAAVPPQSPPPPQVSPNPAVQSNVVQTPQPKGSRPPKILMIIALVLLLLALIGGGAYYYLNYVAKKPTSQTTQNQTPQDLTSLKSDADSLDLGDPNNDFTQVDQDIKGL